MSFFGDTERIIIITGHFGSGKTNFAVNTALFLAAESPVSLIDFDIVNPYFRAADDTRLLSQHGVRCIVPEFANSNVDVPSLPAEILSVFNSKDEKAIFDVGGDDSGATALGTYKNRFEECGYTMLYVFSQYRPLTSTPEDALQVMRDIEAVSRLKCSGLINCSNIGTATTDELFSDSFEFADRLSEISGLPLLCDATFSESEFPGRKIFRMHNVTKNLFGGNTL